MPIIDRKVKDALVAQLDRALDYESRGREFESSRARHSPFFFSKPDNDHNLCRLLLRYDDNRGQIGLLSP